MLKGQFVMSLRTLLFSIFLVVASLGAARAETILVMVEEQGCAWCARWDKEISHIYPKTDVGKAAPLKRIDLHAARPDNLSFKRTLHFTPTFVLMVDGKEVSRLEGYPGEDFFWGLIEKMLAQANIDATG